MTEFPVLGELFLTLERVSLNLIRFNTRFKKKIPKWKLIKACNQSLPVLNCSNGFVCDLALSQMAVRVLPAALALLYRLWNTCFQWRLFLPIKALQRVPLRRAMWILHTYVCFFMYICVCFQKEKELFSYLWVQWEASVTTDRPQITESPLGTQPDGKMKMQPLFISQGCVRVRVCVCRPCSQYLKCLRNIMVEKKLTIFTQRAEWFY